MPATVAGLGALALWAFLAPLATLAQPLPPLLTTALGLGVGGIGGLAVLAARGSLCVLRQPAIVWLHGVGGIGGYHALYFGALALAPAVEANLLNYLWPLLIVVLSAPLRGLRLGPWRLAGAALGFGGAALLLGAGASFSPAAALGFGCAAGAAVVWALYSVLAGRLPNAPTEAVAGFCLVAAVLAGVGHLAFENAAWPDTRQWLWIGCLGAGPLGAAFFLWDIGMKRGDPRLLGTLAYAVPVASTALLLALGIGSPSWHLAAATAMVVAGGLLTMVGNREERRPSVAPVPTG